VKLTYDTQETDELPSAYALGERLAHIDLIGLGILIYTRAAKAQQLDALLPGLYCAAAGGQQARADGEEYGRSERIFTESLTTIMH